MERVSSGIRGRDGLTESFHIGDNDIWEAEAGAPRDAFVKSLVRQSVRERQGLIYASFNRSTRSVLKQTGRDAPGVVHPA